MKKHKFVTITERSGEYEFNTSFVTRGNPHKILQTWRGDGEDYGSNETSFCGGEILGEITDEREIPEADYNVLKQYLSEL